MAKKESHSKRMERKLTEWKSRFDVKRAAATPEMRDKLDASKGTVDKASAKLLELRSAAARWGQIRDELEALLVEMDGVLGEAPVEEPRRVTVTSG